MLQVTLSSRDSFAWTLGSTAVMETGVETPLGMGEKWIFHGFAAPYPGLCPDKAAVAGANLWLAGQDLCHPRGDTGMPEVCWMN